MISYFKVLLPACILVISLNACKQKAIEDQTPTHTPRDSSFVSAANFRLLDSAQMATDLQTLSSLSFAGRKAGTAAVSLSHNLITGRLRVATTDSFSTNYAQDFLLTNVARKNFIAVVKGTQFPDQYIVVGAHYDHLGTTTAGVVYHGADDNASGTAAALAMAKYFSLNKPKHSVIIALWDAEELGVKGSEYFLNNLPAPMSLVQIKFNLNMDMIARSDNNSIWACGLSKYPAFRYLVDSVKPKTFTVLKSGYDKPTDPQDWTYLSDHGSFHRKNIPFLYLGVEDHADYHKTTDSFEKINLNRFTENANIVLQMALLLDRKL